MSLLAKTQRALNLGKLAWEVRALKRADGEQAHHQAMQTIIRRMGSMHGLPQKIAQILSIKELQTEENVFSSLTEALPIASHEEVLGWIEKELRKAPDKIFRHISKEGHSASIAQVHRAELLDGTPVAIKIQYPEIAENLETDLDALGLLSLPLGVKKSVLDMAAYRQELRTSLLSELDFKKECYALSRFTFHRRDIPELQTPDPIQALCTPRLLVMSWLEGERFETTTDWSVAHREALGQTLIRLFLFGCLVWRELHADLHTGNLRFSLTPSGPRVGLIDFGCVKHLSSTMSTSLLQLLTNGANLNQNDAFQLFSELGFDKKLLSPIAEKLPSLIQILTEPFQHTGKFNLQTWKLSERLSAILGEQRWNFRAAGPANMILLIKTYSSLIQYLQALKLPLNWGLELTRALEAIEKKQHGKISAPPPNYTTSIHEIDANIPTQALSKNLYIKVEQNGETRAKLTLGLAVLDDIEELIPDEIKPQLLAQSIEPKKIAAEAKERNYPPGDLFSVTNDKKIIRVWLE